MKPPRFSRFISPASSLGLAAFCFILIPGQLRAAAWYWDSNAATSGAGTTPTGTWGTSTFWSTSSAGTVATTAWTAGNTATFSAGTDATAAYTVTLNGTQSTAGITFEEGTATLSGGGITLTSAAIIGTANATISSPIGGTVGLTKSAAGTLTLSGPNTYTGNTTVNGGTVTVTANQSGATGSWLILGNDGTDNNKVASTANFNTGATISVASGSQIQIGNTTGGGGTLAQNLNVNGTATVTNAGTLFVGRAGTLTFGSSSGWAQSGNATVASQGGYSATLNVNNGTFTYTGANPFAVVSSGTGVATLSVSGTGAFVTGKAINNTSATTNGGANIVLNNGGSLKLSANVANLLTTAGGALNLQVGATGTGGVINTNGFDTSLDRAISNVPSVAGKLVKSGLGTLTLTAASSYTGGTTLSNGSGVIAISHGSALGTGAVALSKGGVDVSALQISGGITVANAFTFSSANGYFATPAGSAHILNTAGSNILTGTLTLTGTGGNGINLQSDAGLLTVSGNVGSTVADSGRVLSVSGAGNGLISGIISNNSASNRVAMEKSGDGTWTFTGANTYSGNSSVRGGTLLLGHNTALGTSAARLSSTTGGSLLTNGAFTIANTILFNTNPTTGTHVLGGNTDNTSTFSGAISLTGDGTVSQVATTGGHVLNLDGAIGSNASGTHTLTLAGPGAIKVNGAISNGSAGTTAVTVSGGDVTFANYNSYSGATQVTGGSLTLSVAGMSDATSVNVESDAALVLNFSGFDIVSGLSFDGAPQAAGTWGAVGSTADHTDARITGTGFLLVAPNFVWNSTGGDGLFSSGMNWNVLTAPTTDAILTFPAGMDTVLMNDLTAGTTLAKLVFPSGAPGYAISGNNLVLLGGIENLSAATQSIGIPITFGANLSFVTSTGMIDLSGALDGAFGFTKSGTGVLQLSAANSFTGPATIAAGTLRIPVAGALPATSGVGFANTTGTATLDFSGVNQTVAGLTFGTQTTGSVLLGGDSLTTSPTTLTFAPAPISGSNLTVDMSAVGAFTYNNAAGTIVMQPGASNLTGLTTVTLSATSNSITTGTLSLAAISGAAGNQSVLNLGLTNTIHANNINLGAAQGRGMGTIKYAAGLSGGGSLEIRNAAGTGGANMIIGRNASFGGDATVYASVFDSTGTAATLDAVLGTLTLGQAYGDAASGRQVTSNGTFKMGAGTLTATSASVGSITSVTPTGTGNTLNGTGLLQLTAGGTANISALTLANNGNANELGTSRIDGQVTIEGGSTLNATTIQQGTVLTGETLRTARINWTDGTIGNIALSDLNVSGVAIVLATTGSHTFNVSGAQTATVSSVISSAVSPVGPTALTKTGTGTLVLSGVNTYVGKTTVSTGTLSITHAFLNDAAALEIGSAGKLDLNFSGTEIVGSYTLDGVVQATGTTYGATGSGAAHIDDVHFSGTGKLQVGVITDPFVGWAGGFSLAGGDALKDADPDHDGRSNLLEFALDGKPNSSSNDGKMRTAVVAIGDDKVLTLTLPVRAGVTFETGGDLVGTVDKVTYKIQGSTDLLDFTTLNVTEVTPALTTDMPQLTLGGGWVYRTFRLPGSIGANPRGFLRASVVEAP